MHIKRIINQALARLAAHWPALSDKLVASFKPMAATSTPWCPVTRPLDQSKVALVTTAGIHHTDQPAFDMRDTDGDPSFRPIVGRTIEGDYAITHDYYDHSDAERDLNIVFPITRLQEMHAAGCIGAIADTHYSFMGHIDGGHVRTLTQQSAPQVARMLKDQQVNAVLLTPA